MPSTILNYFARREPDSDIPLPRILVTTIPKSGTHLIDSILGFFPGLSRLKHAGLNARMVWHPYNYIPWLGSQTCQMGVGRPQTIKVRAFRNSLNRIRPGKYAIGQIPYERNILEIIRRQSLVPVALVRDPRDIAVSSMYHSLNKEHHILHKEITATSDPELRLRKVLFGTEGLATKQLPVTKQFELFKGWAKEPEVLTLRFEDLVGPKGGGTRDRQVTAIVALARHIGMAVSPEEAEEIGEAMFGRGLTFRRGQIGAWREYFSKTVLDEFYSISGDAIRDMGYEQ